MASHDIVFPENWRSFSADSTACAKFLAVAETEIVPVYVRCVGGFVLVELGERWLLEDHSEGAVEDRMAENTSIRVRLADSNIVEVEVRDVELEEFIATCGQFLVGVVEVQLVNGRAQLFRQAEE